MLIRLPIPGSSRWYQNTNSYAKVTTHPLLDVEVLNDTIKLSGAPYVNVRVLLTSMDLTINTPYIDFDPTDWNTYKTFTVVGTGTLTFSDENEIIIPSSITIAGGTLITVGGDQLVVGGIPVII